MNKNLLDRFGLIKTFVFDVDGVLTNGQLIVEADGTLKRSMNIKDGYALQLAIKKGYAIWIISGAKDSGAALRLANLGITELHFGVPNKLALLKELLLKHQVSSVASVAYMGDDMPDVDVIAHCGLKCAPADACMEILNIADYISPKDGGNGCVRDIIEKVMKINGDWC